MTKPESVDIERIRAEVEKLPTEELQAQLDRVQLCDDRALLNRLSEVDGDPRHSSRYLA